MARTYYRKKYVKKKRTNKREDMIINIFAVFAILLSAFLILDTNIRERKVVEIDILDLQSFRIPYKTYSELEKVSEKNGFDFAKLLTIFALENSFFSSPSSVTPTDDVLKQFISDYKRIEKQYPDNKIVDYYTIVKNIHDEVIYFPIPDGYDSFSFVDTYGAARTYGGERIHQGTDIMEQNNIRGKIPIVSMTDGIVENIGWNEKGGFRVGVRTSSGN